MQICQGECPNQTEYEKLLHIGNHDEYHCLFLLPTEGLEHSERLNTNAAFLPNSLCQVVAQRFFGFKDNRISKSESLHSVHAVCWVLNSILKL